MGIYIYTGFFRKLLTGKGYADSDAKLGEGFGVKGPGAASAKYLE